MASPRPTLNSLSIAIIFVMAMLKLFKVGLGEAIR